MMYVVQKNAEGGDQQWLSKAQPMMIWGDKRHAMLFETRALAQMAATAAARKAATRNERALEVVFIPDASRWRE
jgi:hypothetical protein